MTLQQKELKVSIIFLNNCYQKYVKLSSLAVHPKDLERVKTDDFWLQRFIVHNKNDIKKATDMLWTSLIWRRDNNINGNY